MTYQNVRNWWVLRMHLGFESVIIGLDCLLIVVLPRSPELRIVKIYIDFFRSRTLITPYRPHLQ